MSPSCPPLWHLTSRVASGARLGRPRWSLRLAGAGLREGPGSWVPALNRAGLAVLAFLVDEGKRDRQKAREVQGGRRPGHTCATAQSPVQDEGKGPVVTALALTTSGPLRPKRGPGGGSGDPSNKGGATASVQGEAGGGDRPTASDSGLGRTETGAGAGQPRAAPSLAHWVISPAKQAGQTHLSPKLPFP